MLQFLRTPSALVVVLCSVVSVASGSQYLFNRADFPTANLPVAVAVGDFNGDGRQDVVVANQFENTISVLLGQANGTLGLKTDLPVGTTPVAVAVGDFNGDGKADIAVVDECGQGCGFISILLGNGDGTFGPHVDYATGTSPIGLVLADFNGDGIIDLAVGSSSVSILLGRGDGTFQTKTDYSVGQDVSAIVAADFNRDGKIDLVTVGSSNMVAVLLGNGDGTFQAHVDSPSSAGPSGIAAGDFNGDRIPDVVVTHSVAPWALTIMIGNGDGTFQPEQPLASDLTTSVVATADLNGDGKLDLVLTIVSQGGPVVFLGNGDGTFQPQVNYASGVYPLGLAIQDMNGDGNLDLVVTDWESNYLTVLLGNGDGTFSPRTNLPIGPPTFTISATIADFNGDGTPDLAVAPGSGTISVLLGKGKGAFQPPLNTGLNGGLTAAADFNGDGRTDLVFSTGGGAEVALGNGDGTFGTLVQILTGLTATPRGLVTGDFNNDGKQDVIVVANGFLQSQPIYVVLGNGDGTFQPAKQFWNSTSIPTEIAAADFNHDGKLDLVVVLNPNGIAVMLGNGDGTFQSPVTYTTDELPSGLTVADVNHDGIPDIIATGNLVDVFLGKGDGTFSASVNYNGGNFPQQVITADVNADGKLDIIVAALGNTSFGALEILLGNGDGTFQSPLEITSGSFGLMAAGDLNQDGTADIVTSGYTGAIFFSGPIATLSPVSINFGPVDLSTTSSAKSLTLANSGNAPLELGGITATANYATTNTCGNSVGLSSSCMVNVTFSPATLGSSSGVLTITDNAPPGQQKVSLSGSGQVDFSVTPASTTLTLQPGAQGTDVMTLAAVGGSFGSAVQLTCAVTGPTPLPTCSFSPSSVTPGATSATSTLTVTAPAAVAMQSPPIRLRFSRFAYAIWLPLILAISLAGGSKEKQRRYALCGFVLLFVLQTACGGGSGGNGGGSPPPKNYTVTVTGTSGAIQHTTQVNVTVQ